MKRTLLLLVMLVGAIAAVPAAHADADVSVDFFYDNLEGGSWIEVGDYGYCWQPDIAARDREWRPYADGYWAYTDDGWTWVSYEDFGWATYHYGRWAHLEDMGWIWVPGRDEDLEWGPAWVSWRTSDEYVGWAPLPPAEPIYEGGEITGDVDIAYDIGPAYYNFIEVRYIGEPVLRRHICPIVQNITFVNVTINVTNITYRNHVVCNYGPDINVVSRHATRPIQRLKIQRQNNVNFAAAARSGGMKSRVQGQMLVIPAPQRIAKPARSVAPRMVKTKVAKPNLDTGWAAAGVRDAQAKAQFKQNLKAREANRPHAMDAAAGANVRRLPTVSPSPGEQAGANNQLPNAPGGLGHDAGRVRPNLNENAVVNPNTLPPNTGNQQNEARRLLRERQLNHGQPLPTQPNPSAANAGGNSLPPQKTFDGQPAFKQGAVDNESPQQLAPNGGQGQATGNPPNAESLARQRQIQQQQLQQQRAQQRQQQQNQQQGGGGRNKQPPPSPTP